MRGTTRPSAAPTTTMPRSFGDFAVFAAPAVFLLLWSSGFVFAKLGLQYAEPLTHLAVRMTAVVAILAVIIAVTKPKWPTRVQASPSPAQSSCCLEISSSECTPGVVEREMKAVNSVAIGFEFRKKYIRARAWMYRINNEKTMLRPAAMRGMQGTLIGWVERSAPAAPAARSKYPSAFAASGLGDLSEISPATRLTSTSNHLSLVVSTAVIASPTVRSDAKGGTINDQQDRHDLDRSE